MKFKKLYIILIIIFLMAGLLLWGNSAIEINEFNIKSTNIPESFNGFRIAQISDLHNKSFGKDNKKLIKLLKSTKPDIIVITGDIADAFNTDIEVALKFSEDAAKIAPTYYVNGNHEAGIKEYDELKNCLINNNVTVLENATSEICIGDSAITIIGINDPSFETMPLDEIIPQNDSFKILLAHRPEYFNTYSGKVDLVFCGHAHGGQFIIPFVGGVVAPGQGFFPKYYEGVYSMNNTQMIVSRGLGNSIIPLRINNRPEIVVAELTKK